MYFSNLASNDFHYEVVMSALIEILKNKKNLDGTPFVTDKEFDEKVKEIQADMEAKMKILAPTTSTIIKPGA